MKIQCDVCNKDEASVFCTADEAVLCAACDHRVHHANKLASKHQRFSLHLPSSKQIPLCDICQVSFLFSIPTNYITTFFFSFLCLTKNIFLNFFSFFFIFVLNLEGEKSVPVLSAGQGDPLQRVRPPDSLGQRAHPETQPLSSHWC